MPRLAECLKELRTNRKISQKTLAEYLNVSQNAVFQWENEKCEPSLEMIEKIAHYFEVTPDFLMGWGKDVNIVEPQTEELRKEIHDLTYSLNDSGLIKTREYMNDLISNPKNKIK